MKQMILSFSGFFLCAIFALVPPSLANQSYQPLQAKAQYTVFAKTIEDLPIMSGFDIVEEKDLLILFGTQRIAQTTLKGRVDIDQAYYFYGRVLPELGWTKIDTKNYTRNGERLSMHPSSANEKGITYIRFEIEPLKTQQ